MTTAHEAFEQQLEALRARKAANEKRLAENQARRDEEARKAARERAEADKERTYQEYLAVGGAPEDFPAFWAIRGPEIVAERMRALNNRIARPHDYIDGPGGDMGPDTFGPVN